MASCFCRRVDEKRLNRKTRDPAPRTLLLRLVSGGRERARSCLLKATSQAARARRYRVELITAESEASLFVRHRRLIRFPQLTMPLLAAWTPDHWEVSHTDEIVQRVDFNKRVDLVGITANTPAAPHAYALAHEFRRRGVAVAVGGGRPPPISFRKWAYLHPGSVSGRGGRVSASPVAPYSACNRERS